MEFLLYPLLPYAVPSNGHLHLLMYREIEFPLPSHIYTLAIPTEPGVDTIPLRQFFFLSLSHYYLSGLCWTSRR
jgi:hypothetical protein